MNDEPVFSLWRTLRLSSFQIGSAMADVFTAGVWNRIMIVDFGIPAWPVGLLIALRYFMSPLSLWAGSRSDSSGAAGFQRTPYIWAGRGLMVLAFLLLGASTVRLGRDTGDPVGWGMAVACFILYGMGTLISGSPYLALVRDSAPPARQGLAISIVETMLITMFPVAAIAFGRMMAHYDETIFWRTVTTTVVIGAFFWVFAIIGVEKRRPASPASTSDEDDINFVDIMKRIWQDLRTRRFFRFLFVATFAAWMQDNILEPLGGEVFDMPVNQTTRLTAYWGTATVLLLLISFFVWRRRRPEQQAGIARVGLGIMAAGLLVVAASSARVDERLFLSGLMVFGSGFGLYTFGGVSLMAAMSPDPLSGAYLGLWTVAILVSKGLGTFAGGLLRDLFLAGGLAETSAYALVFAIAAAGLAGAIFVLRGIDVPAFVRDAGQDNVKELPLASVEL